MYFRLEQRRQSADRSEPIGGGEPGVSEQGREAATIPSRTDSLARRLLRSVCAIYFAVIFVVTGFQIAAAYRHAEARLEQDLEALRSTFGQGIADAVWGLNDDVVASILGGMVQLPEVAGVSVQDEHGTRIDAVGLIRNADGAAAFIDSLGHAAPVQGHRGFVDTLLARSFDLVHADSRGRRSIIGTWTVYSDRHTVVGEIKSYVSVLLVSAAIKSVALSLITYVVVTRLIGQPLRQLSDYVAGLNIDNLGTQPLLLKGSGSHELHMLAAALNVMAAKLRRSIEENGRLVQNLGEANENLQVRVAERTQELERLATTDQLTGLANRRKLDELLAYEGARAVRHGHGLGIVVCDVDHFKTVNDTHGHQAGDVVLIALGHLLRSTVRETDTAGRWGGEEFMIVSPDIRLHGAVQMAERVRQRIAGATFPAVGSQTCSFGVAELLPDETIEAMVRRADAALYRAKSGGRNRVVAADATD